MCGSHISSRHYMQKDDNKVRCTYLSPTIHRLDHRNEVMWRTNTITQLHRCWNLTKTHVHEIKTYTQKQSKPYQPEFAMHTCNTTPTPVS